MSSSRRRPTTVEFIRRFSPLPCLQKRDAGIRSGDLTGRDAIRNTAAIRIAGKKQMNKSKAITREGWWQRGKRQVWRRDKGRCRLCGKSYPRGSPDRMGWMRVAHIKARRNHPELERDIRNMVLICAWCDGEFGESLEEELRRERR